MGELNLKKDSMIWDGVRQGFYEAFYIQINHPVSGMAWWFRYSVMIPREGRGLPYAALLAIQYDESGTVGPFAMKHIYPLSHVRSEKDRFILYIEDGFISSSHAKGKIKHGDRSIEWDIKWTPVGNNFIHYPSFLYKAPLPRTKVVAPHWATTGGGFVRSNEGELFLKDALIHVGHVWGNSHSKKWVWVRSHGFEENPMAVFEGLFAPICDPVGLAVCWFQLDGYLSRFVGGGFKWPLKAFLKSNQWGIVLTNSRFKIDGVVEVDPSQVAGVTYHDPDGSRRFCYNSKVATIRADVLDKKSGDRLRLTAPHTAAFEICLPYELNKFQMLV